MGLRLKIQFKWGILLFVVASLFFLAGTFIAGFVAGTTLTPPITEEKLTPYVLVATIIAMIITLPFAYTFSYKAAAEYLKSGDESATKKNMGMSIAISVVFISTILGSLLTLLFTGELNYQIGFIPLILAFIAGRNAEKRFSSQAPVIDVSYSNNSSTSPPK